MNSQEIFIDLHCHPSARPYAKSFTKSFKHSTNPKDANCVWFDDRPTLIDKFVNELTGLTRFEQADYTAQIRGNVRIIVHSLYPFERGFLNNKLGQGAVADMVGRFVSQLGQERIDAIQNQDDYFGDLTQEYKFLQDGQNRPVKLPEGDFTYTLTTDWDDIDGGLRQNDLGKTKQRLLVILSIEGAHVFNTGLDSTRIAPAAERHDEILANTQAVKDWSFRPFFMTFAHHFNNELCGHARSLAGIVAKLTDQSENLNAGFSPLGREVVLKLLDNTAGKRILIDIKHMSRKARLEYFQLLDEQFTNDPIPIIISHGCVTGRPNPEATQPTFPDQGDRFNTDDINFFDDELIRLARSGGIFGIQLDERRIGSKSALNAAKGNISRRTILFNWARLVWYQIQHIAEVLDASGLFAWNIQALGTDFDGLIDPINGYWTAKELDDLDDYLLKHAFNYLQTDNPENRLTLPANKQIQAEEVVRLVMQDNALEFIQRHYHSAPSSIA
ncbi:amidohydrolase family protein [Spirosoma flavum]|uniref:Peptidase M19 n=1 Tax=Spirosoma flavum TaxID=2048557 RepID=A0ABW6AHX1_9BACT